MEPQILVPDDWRDWRDIRLRALAESPAAFGSTLEKESAFGEEEWRERTVGSFLVRDAALPVSMGAGWCDRPGGLTVVAMWTDPGWRGRGLGGAVLDAITAWAVEQGLRPRLFAMLANPDAERLYRRHGYVRTGLVEDHGGRPAAELELPA